MHAFDGQTDGRTDLRTDRILIAIPRLHCMQRGKKLVDACFLLYFYALIICHVLEAYGCHQ